MISQFDFEPVKVKIMGSGKLKDKEKTQGETVNGRSSLTKQKKMSKIDTMRMSAVDNLKGISEKASESLTTFFNIKENDRTTKDGNVPIAEEDASMYKPLIQSQKSRINEDGASPTKKPSMIEVATRVFGREEPETANRQVNNFGIKKNK